MNEPPAVDPLGGLLGGLTPDQRGLAEASLETLRFEFGDTLVAAGDEADGVYVMREGRARVVGVGEDGAEVSLNVLHAGDVFGERGLVEGGKRTATVRAASDLVVERLHRSVFLAVARMDQRGAAWAEAAARGHRLRDTLRTHPVLGRADAALFTELGEAASERNVRTGELLARAGERVAKVAVLLEGRAVSVEPEGSVAAWLRPGALVGAAEALDAAPHSLTVETREAGRVAEIDASALREALAARPRLREQLAGTRPTRASGERVPLDFAAGEAGRAARRSSGSDPEQAQELAEIAALDEAVRRDAEVVPPDAEGDPEPRRTRRFPLVRQLDAMDCGAACLAMVCRSFGHDVSMNAIRQAVGTSVDGTTLRGLQRGGEEIGVAVRTIKSSQEGLDDLPLPAILHWGGNHWVVLHRVDGDRVWLADPALGRRRIDREELGGAWSGFTALPAPTPKLAEAPRQRIEVAWLWPLIRPHRRTYAIALLLAFVVSGLEMLLPLFSQRAVDDVVGSNDRSELNLILVQMAGVIALATGASLLQRLMLARAAVELDRAALDRLTSRLLLLPMRYFESRKTADVQRRVTGVQQVRAVLIEQGLTVVTSACQLIAAVVMMAFVSQTLWIAFLATLPVYVALTRLSGLKLRPIFQRLEESTSRYQSRQVDTIRGIEAVKLVGAEETTRRRIIGEFDRLRRRLLSADIVRLIFDGVGEIVGFVVFALFLYLGISEVISGDLTLGEFVAFNALVAFASGPLGVLLGAWDDVQHSTILLSRLQDVFEQEPEQPEGRPGLRAVPSLEGRVTLREVGFAYPRTPERPVLQDLTLDIPPGTTVALVGRSGSGKSTLVRILAGLVLPTDGEVRFDGVELRELRFDDLRGCVGFVPQQPYVFDETMAVNIAYGEEEPDLERVRVAAELAAADEFIGGLPLGYQTRVGDSGLRLSGGQAQRVAIARALYSDPSVLIFDEATSALDAESERMLQDNLAPILADRTAFVVTHRLTTARQADLICVVEQGRIAERGTHDELLARGGLYAHLWGQQSS